MESARFYCERHDPACGGHVEVPLDEYEDLRAESTRFVDLPSHVETPSSGSWRASGGYAVVEKFGRRLAAVVRRLDPRTNTT